MTTSIPNYRQRASRVSCMLDTHCSWHICNDTFTLRYMIRFCHYQPLPSMLYLLQSQIKHARLSKRFVQTPRFNHLVTMHSFQKYMTFIYIHITCIYTFIQHME